MVVLGPDPRPPAEVRAPHQRQERLRRVHRRHGPERRRGRGGHPRPVVLRRRPRQRLERQIGLHLPAQRHDEAVLGDRLAHHGEIEVPLVEHRPRLRLLLRPQHHQHPLLALGQHHLVGGHPRLAHRHPVEVEPDPEVPLVPHLHRRAGQPRRAHVLDRDDRAGRHQLQARLHQPLLGEGVAHLHRRPLLLDRGVELGRRHGRPADPVPPGLRPEIDHRHPHARGRRVEDGIGLREPRREGVDQAVAVVGRMEPELAADGRHPEGVPVAADPRDHPVHQAPRPRMRGLAEGERVHRRDRPRPHGEDVAQDAAHPGRRALIGLDVGGVVVALHLEDQRLPVADVDDAGVLPRPADHLAPGGRQRPEPLLRRLVRAVLVPHRREDPELGQRRRPPDQVEDALVLVRLQPVRGDERVGDLGLEEEGVGHRRFPEAILASLLPPAPGRSGRRTAAAKKKAER